MDRFEIKKTPDGKLLARRKDGQPLTAEDREQLAGMKEQMKLDFPKTFPGRTDSKAISCDLESGEIVAVAIVSEILDAEIWLSFRDNFNPQDNRAVFFAHELPTLRTKTANQLRAIHSVKLTFPKSINKRTAA
jgi:hypothetical protein